MLGLVLVVPMLGDRLDGGAIERGDGLVVVDRERAEFGSWFVIGETSMPSKGDSRDEAANDCGRCFEVSESSEVSVPINGTV